MAEMIYFDYVSADLLEEIIGGIEIRNDTGSIPDQSMHAKISEGIESSDEFSLFTHIDSFFKKFGFTDVILFQKADQTSAQKLAQKSASAPAQKPTPPFYHKLFETPDHSIRYHKGIEIEVDTENELNALIRKERPKADFLIVRSDDDKMIRAAANSGDVDIIIPISNHAQKPAAGKINHIIAKIAADKKTAFAFDIAPFLFIKGYRRSKLFSDIMEMIPVLRKYHVPVLLFSGAGNVFEIRGPYELEAVGRLFGMTQEETVLAVSDFPQKIISERQKKKSGIIISQGVEIFSEEKDVEIFSEESLEK